MLKGLN